MTSTDARVGEPYRELTAPGQRPRKATVVDGRSRSEAATEEPTNRRPAGPVV